MLNILEPGVVLRKRYEIIELAGQGGQGAVYKASDRRLEGRVCAIKETLPALYNLTRTEDLAQMAEQFRVEASTLAQLDHPNLPKVSDYFSEGNREYLVQDFVAGRDLQEIIHEAQRRGKFLEEPKVLDWATQVLDALEYLHDRDPAVLHRDIKPSNIKVTPQGIVKLVDFGLVKLLQADDTRTVTVVQGRGTAAYTPLEQYGSDNGSTDTRSDIYSLGATLYHLLTGEPPVDAKERFLHPGQLASIRDINAAVSPRVERTTFQALSMHPNERPASAREFRDMLLGSRMPTNSVRVDTNSTQMDWGAVLYQNRLLLGAASILLVLAILLSIYSQDMPLPWVAV